MKTVLFLLFSILLAIPSNAQFLLIKGQSGPTSFPFGKGPYGTIGGVTPASGNVTVLTGQTLTLVAGTTYDFKSLTVNSGGFINITGHGIVLIGSVGNVVINGTVTSDFSSPDYTTSGCTKNFSITEIGSTTSYSATYTFMNYLYDGGNGGRGGSPYNGNQYPAGGTPGWEPWFASGQTCGVGSSGGGGGAIDSTIQGCAPCTGFCKLCNPDKYCGAGDGTGADYIVGANATNLYGNNTTLAAGSIGGSGGSNYGGTGGGAVGGTGGISGANYGGGGGGGGFHGGSASSLVIKTRGSFSGAGTINLKGQAGFNGANGGAGQRANGGSGAGGGGGGGGGSGGFGGNFKVLTKSGNTFSSANVLLTGGAAGAGGIAGSTAGNADDYAHNGDAGSVGGNGTYSPLTW